jgi:hypothetical protein
MFALGCASEDASRLFAKLAEHRNPTSHVTVNPTHRASRVFEALSKHPDSVSAHALRTPLATRNALDFDRPKDGHRVRTDNVRVALVAGSTTCSKLPPACAGGRPDRGSSVVLPAKVQQTDCTSMSGYNGNPHSAGLQAFRHTECVFTPCKINPKSSVGPFVTSAKPRMTSLGPFRRNSHVVADITVWPGRGGQPTDRWRDKMGSPHVSQAIDMTWLRTGASVGARAAHRRTPCHFKHHFGTAHLISAQEGTDERPR